MTTPVPRAIRLAQIEELLEQGLTHQQVADRLGIRRGAVRNVLNDPDGSKQRARRASYAGACDKCGRQTRSNGTSKPSPRCRKCAKQEKYWTQERVVEALQRWVGEHGRPPSASEWSKSKNGYPALGSVYRSTKRSSAPFATWNDAIRAAGYTPTPRGQYPRLGTVQFGPRLEAVLELVRSQKGPVRWRDLAAANDGAPQHLSDRLNRLVERGLIVRLERGLYAPVREEVTA